MASTSHPGKGSRNGAPGDSDQDSSQVSSPGSTDPNSHHLVGVAAGVVAVGEVFEAGGVLDEGQLDGVDGTVALFRNDDFGYAFDLGGDFVFLLYISSRKMKATTSASCSMEPDSRRSLSWGRRLRCCGFPERGSTARARSRGL